MIKSSSSNQSYGNANYGSRQAPPSAYVKSFISPISNPLLKIVDNPTSSIVLISNNYDFRVPNDLYVGGDLIVSGSIITSSDERLKDEIKTIDKDVYNNILNLSPKNYYFKDDVNKKKHYGFIAQDVEKIYPELIVNEIDNNGDEMKSINYIELIPFLVAKIQDLQKEVDLLKANIV